MDRALKKLNGSLSSLKHAWENAMLINYIRCFIIITFK